MADVVQRHMESMTEQMEEMRRSKIFTNEEIGRIIKKRQDYEYKINGVSKNLQDFKDYINYEKDLHKNVRTKRDKKFIAERKNAIEYKILRRIKNIYEITLQRFSEDFSLCLDYFQFCKESNYSNAANVTVESMLKNWSHNPEVWKIAASWKANEKNDINSAITILRKGLIIHKDNKMLYIEAIKMELSLIKEEQGEKAEKVRQVVHKKLQTYIRLITDNIKDDDDFLIEVLGVLECYKHSDSVQNFIIQKLLQLYSERKSVWSCLASRELRGLHYSMDNTPCTQSRLSLCLDKLKEGIAKVDQSDKQDLWAQYLERLVRIQNEKNELHEQDKKVLLKSALKEASEQNFLTEAYYIEWLRHVADEEALGILDKGTKCLPESKDLWKLRLRYATLTNKNPEVDRVFKEGREALKENSLPLWNMYLRYYILLSRVDVIEETYKLGIKEPEEISQVLKPKYIEWLALAKDMETTRKVYKELALGRPYCKELHLTMSKLESTEIVLNFDKWAEVHELTCRQFGETEVDVWINHIMFYIHFNKNVDVQIKVQSIYREAERVLSPLLLSDLEEKYASAFQKI